MAKEKSDWMQTLWRPMMGWMYMLICLLDMAVFPVLWALWQGLNHVPITQWNPLTLQGAGLFHIAMGAVLGISAFGRTQEKLAGTAANPTATEQISVNSTSMSGVPAGGMGGGGFGGNSGGFGGNSGGFGGNTGGFGGQQSGGFGGSSMGGGSTFGAPAAGGFGSPSGGFGSTPAPATSSFGGGGFGSAPTTTAPATSSFGVAPSGIPVAAPDTGAGVSQGFGGKLAPPPAVQPAL